MRSDDAYLLDMLVAAREAREFTSCMTFAEFGRNRMAQLAVLKSVEVVGEAASRLSSEGIKMHREILWKKIIGMRNRLVHGYFDINLKRVGRLCKTTFRSSFRDLNRTFRRKLKSREKGPLDQDRPYDGMIAAEATE